MRSINKQHLIYTLCVMVSLVCVVSFSIRFLEQYSLEKKLSSIEKNLENLSHIAKDKKRAEEITKNGDPLYLQNAFSSLPLLNFERGALELAQKSRPLSEEETRRFHFLTKENLFCFKSHRKVSCGSFHEVEEKLISTVQIDENDLPKILAKLENTSACSIRIKRCFLERHDHFPTFNLYLELWRKES